MNHLHNLMKLAKIMKIFSAIAKVFCLIAAIVSVAGIVCVCILYGRTEIVEALLQDETLTDALMGTVLYAYVGYAADNVNLLLNTLLDYSVVCLIMALTNYVLARESYAYYKHLILEGTPFTYQGAEEIKNLGWHEILFSIAATVICTILESILAIVLGELIPFSSASGAVIPAIGVFYLILSVVFRYGAFVSKNNGNTI